MDRIKKVVNFPAAGAKGDILGARRRIEDARAADTINLWSGDSSSMTFRRYGISFAGKERSNHGREDKKLPRIQRGLLAKAPTPRILRLSAILTVGLSLGVCHGQPGGLPSKPIQKGVRRAWRPTPVRLAVPWLPLQFSGWRSGLTFLSWRFLCKFSLHLTKNSPGVDPLVGGLSRQCGVFSQGGTGTVGLQGALPGELNPGHCRVFVSFEYMRRTLTNSQDFTVK